MTLDAATLPPPPVPHAAPALLAPTPPMPDQTILHQTILHQTVLDLPARCGLEAVRERLRHDDACRQTAGAVRRHIQFDRVMPEDEPFAGN